MAAFRASRFVCPAMSLISSRISPIFCARSPSESARSAMASTFSCMSRIVSPVRSAAFATACALSAIEPAVVASSSIVADVSATADDCSLVTAAAFFAASRSSPVTSPRTAEVERSRAQKLVQPAERRRQFVLPARGPGAAAGARTTRKRCRPGPRGCQRPPRSRAPGWTLTRPPLALWSPGSSERQSSRVSGPMTTGSASMSCLLAALSRDSVVPAAIRTWLKGQ